MSILAVYRDPFSTAPRVAWLPERATLAEMRASMPGLPDDFDSRGVICIAGHPVNRSMWHVVRPRPLTPNGVQVEVTFHAPPMGGGDNGGKSILALVAGIALTFGVGAIAGGALATKGGLFAAGSLSARVLAAGVSLAGSLLISALIPPPTVSNQRSPRIDNPGAASAQGNLLEANAPIPRVAGERKVFPPLLAEQLIYFSGPDEVVEAVYALSGPHRLRDVRIGAAPIDDMADVEYETREGWPGDPRISILSRQSRTEALQTELRGHTVSADDNRTLETVTGDFSTALPSPQIVATREAPDEHQLQLIFPQGLHKNASETTRMRVPVRLRMRRIGELEWINLPELHFQAASLRQLRATVRILWRADASTTPGAASPEGWVEARVESPGQTAAPEQPARLADPYFYTGSGDVWLNQGNTGSTGVDHVILDRYTAAIYLDEAIFPRGRYEIEIVRGAPFNNSNWSASAYTISGSVWDLFGLRGTPGQIPESTDGVADALYLLRSVSIWDQHPAPGGELALIAVRARNRALEQLSVIAGGYVPDWDGTGWTGAHVTDNPAPHLRDIWTGRQNADPVPVEIVQDDELVAWRQACIDEGYQCNALLEAATVDEAARIVAATGYAKPYTSEVWGVFRDYDRSAEAPVQVFTPRNSSGFSFRKAFPRVPDGFRVNFRDATRDYDSRQITVFRPGASADSGLLEQVSYEGLVTEAEVTRRAEYDQAQARLRGTFYSLDAPVEALVCRRGDLVAVQHDSLSSHAAAARVIHAEFEGADLSAVWLDSAVPVRNEVDFLAVPDLLAVPDMLAIGARTGIALRRSTGSVTVHPVANATGDADVIEFDPPIPAAGVKVDTLATIGPLGREYERLIVFAMEPREDLTASLTLVDEAPELWA